MKTKLSRVVRLLGLLGLLLVVTGMTVAAGSLQSPPTGGPARGGPAVSLPEQARPVAPGVYYLGRAVDKGRVVEGYAFLRYKKGHVKPGTECGNGICEPGENANKCPEDCGGTIHDPDTSSCYGFLARGAKWKTVEDYDVNPANSRGLDEGDLAAKIAADIAEWEAAAGVDILGSGSSTDDTLEADTVSTDGLNEVYFGDIAEPGVIAFAIIWGIFGGPPQYRELVEWDQVYDEVDFDWSLSGESGKMDFENIATHELGHSVGMGDLYTSDCAEVTMYGYATDGETKKSSLEAGDIVGVAKLYQ